MHQIGRLSHRNNLADLLSCSCKIHVQPPIVDGDDELVTTKVCDLCSSGAGQLPLLRDLASIRDENLCHWPSCGVFGSQIIFAGSLETYERPLSPSRTATAELYPRNTLTTKPNRLWLSSTGTMGKRIFMLFPVFPFLCVSLPLLSLDIPVFCFDVAEKKPNGLAW
ncbi:hypothetical protein DVH24_030090 [Malus domestica]|uniref:Uncharacterized protein n=1 Tax=Malus domestica TaxID=3750 RepID=A0A498HXL4_MALDO|nr:hypothetical protein DVH24_030090 [Malus domestica]